LRAFGSRAPTSSRSKSQGRRLQHAEIGVATVAKPLEAVYLRLERWFNKEREYNHEVRTKTLTMRLIFEIEYERDKQLVLREHESKLFKSFVFNACVEKLSFLTLTLPDKRQTNYLECTVFKRIRATRRSGQKFSEKDSSLDEVKALLTWATSDRMIHLVARGSQEDLQVFVQDTDRFIEQRKDTSFVVIDQTALWLKLRGEEKVLTSFAEKTSADERKKLSRKAKKVDKSDAAAWAELQREHEIFGQEHPESRPQVQATYSTAGDKYRLTLINVSGVEKWFDPSTSPIPIKRKCVLLVFCQVHAKLQDISEDGKWLRDVSYPKSDGTIASFKTGEPVGHILSSWHIYICLFVYIYIYIYI
jgi:hypothetical protein